MTETNKETIKLDATETVTDLKNLELMFKLQDTYDKEVYAAYTEDQKPSADQILRAILDELGEVNHEDKASFCWWKKTQKPVDNEKLLEEIADLMHFVLMYTIEYGDKEASIKAVKDEIISLYFIKKLAEEGTIKSHNVSNAYYGLMQIISYCGAYEQLKENGELKAATIEKLNELENKTGHEESAMASVIEELENSYRNNMVGSVYELAAVHGFSMTDVFEAYVKKNTTNKERIANGY